MKNTLHIFSLRNLFFDIAVKKYSVFKIQSSRDLQDVTAFCLREDCTLQVFSVPNTFKSICVVKKCSRVNYLTANLDFKKCVVLEALIFVN